MSVLFIRNWIARGSYWVEGCLGVGAGLYLVAKKTFFSVLQMESQSHNL
jgi:hypothetical protein